MNNKPGNILLAAATAKEVAPFLVDMRKRSGQFGLVQLDVLITGIGLTATTFRLTRQLQLKKYDLVIQAGVAGCFDSKTALGSVVVVEKDTIADESVIELKKMIWDPKRTLSYAQLAKNFGVSQMQIYRIKSCEIWFHIKVGNEPLSDRYTQNLKNIAYQQKNKPLNKKIVKKKDKVEKNVKKKKDKKLKKKNRK